jgi:hypothetical protein
MELSIDPETAERIAWGSCGVLSFIALIIWLRSVGTRRIRKRLCREKKRMISGALSCAALPMKPLFTQFPEFDFCFQVRFTPKSGHC